MEVETTGCCGKIQKEINFHLLPIKIHYFVLFAALGGVMPYIPVVAKGLGISATAVGIIFTILPFTVMVAKPIFGAITDHFQNIKIVISVFIIFTSVSYFLIVFIPPITPDPPDDTIVFLKCTERLTELTFPQIYKPSCLSDTLFSVGKCNIQISRCWPLRNQSNESRDDATSCNPICNETGSNLTTRYLSSRLNSDQSRFGIGSIDNSGRHVPTTCSCVTSAVATFTCTPSIQNCSSPHRKKEADSHSDEIYFTYQFWTFGILCILAGMGQGVMFSLSDAVCYELLGNKPNQYGRQRLWATISWGVVALITGFLNDLASEGSTRTNYSPGFYLLVSLSFIDLILLSRIKLTKTTFSSNICQDIGSVFVTCEAVTFAIAVFIIGGLTGILWNYQLWFLENLGASQLLLGLTIIVQCLLAEVPLFFFSGFIIDKLGHMNCITLTFAAFSLRFIFYYSLKDPWYVLPIELLHGQTFGIFYATMTSYARVSALPGSEATMQGVLGGLYEGLGNAMGALIGGFAFDSMGGHRFFLTISGVSALCTIFFCVTGVLLRLKKNRQINAQQSANVTPMFPTTDSE